MLTMKTMTSSKALTFGMIMIASLLPSVLGHGYLMHPPQRSSAWRFGFQTPTNYDDNTQFCGGFGVGLIFWYSYHIKPVTIYRVLSSFLNTPLTGSIIVYIGTLKLK